MYFITLEICSPHKFCLFFIYRGYKWIYEEEGTENYSQNRESNVFEAVLQFAIYGQISSSKKDVVYDGSIYDL